MARNSRATLSQQGRGLLAGGLTAAVAGLVLGERDLVRLGLVVAVLPILALVWLRIACGRVETTRTITPDTVEVGRAADVELLVTHSGLRLSDVVLREHHSDALGEFPHLQIPSLRRGQQVPLHYRLVGTVRGIFEIGPAEVTVSDPFGLARLVQTVGDAQTVTVTPRIHDLDPIRFPATWAGAGESRPRAFAVGNAADVTVREYRIGDDLRRVHWRSTARTGELMVRREEQPWQSRCTLMLDNRATSHRGVRVDSSFELAVSTAGSITVHLARLGYQVRFVSANGAEIGGWHDGESILNTESLLRELAQLQLIEQTGLDSGWIDDTTSQSLLVGVFGVLHDADLGFLRGLRHRGVTNHALAIDPSPWSDRPGDVPATGMLVDEGWQAVTVASGDDLPHAWRELGR